MPGSDRLDIRLLGPLEVLAAGAPLVVDTRKALAILALLATEQRPFARDELAAMLWPDADDEAARGALRRTLSTLRAALDDRWLVVDRARVALDRKHVTTDVMRAAELAARDDESRLSSAADLHRGPFLAGFSLRDAPAFDDWQASRATAMVASLSAILDRLATLRHELGDRTGAVAAARRRVDLDPLDEAAQRRLIELLALVGDRAGAIRQYRACVAVLDAELGVPPLDETTELYERIRDEPGATTDRPSGAVHREAAPPSTAAPVLTPYSAPLVGRSADLDALLAALHAARTQGAIAVVEGEAGIGKTRLLEAFLEAAAERGSRAMGSRAYPGEQGVAYAPLIALLRSAAADPEGARRIATLEPPVRIALAGLVPALGQLDDLREHTPESVDPRAARSRLLDAIAGALGTLLAGSAPGVVWIDDLHLADEATLEAIGYVTRRIADRPLLFVATWRTEDLEGEAALLASRLRRVAHVVRQLRRLERDDVATLIASLATTGPADPVADRIIQRSEGLPLYVVEALAAALDETADGGEVPAGVRAVLGERLASLEGTAAQVLGAAAVIGRSFDVDTVRAVSGRTEDETVDALDRLVRRGFLREAGPAPGQAPTFEFGHESVRDVAQADLSIARRRLLHRRIAEELSGRTVGALAEGGTVDRLDGNLAASVAQHLAASGHEAAAARAYARAGEHARSIHANAEAVAHLEAAIALGHPDRQRLHLEAGDLATLRGRYVAAIRHYEAAASLLGDRSAADVEYRLGLVHQRRGEPARADGHFVSALTELPSGPIRANALADRSLNARDAGELGRASALAREALEEAEASDDVRAIARAANVAGLLAAESGDGSGARVLLERSLALATDEGYVDGRIAALNNLAKAVSAAGDVERGIALTDEALALCVAIGDQHREAALHNNLADLLHAVGRRDEAMAHLKRAVALFAEVGEPGALEPGKWRMATW